MNVRKLSICLILLTTLFPIFKTLADVTNVSVSVFIAQCSDGVDNDGDNLTDYPLDPGCSSAIDNNETDVVVTYQCSDGADNDNDGDIDYPSDLGCDSSTDDSEDGEIKSTGGGWLPDPAATAPVNTQVVFRGEAPIGVKITLVANGNVIAKTDVASDGTFNLVINELPPNTYIFLLYGKSEEGQSSRPLSYAFKIGPGSVTEINGIVIKFDKLEEENKDKDENGCPTYGDLNGDCKVDLIDFSIASYWWERDLDATFAKQELKHLNGDGKIDLQDFSILAYNWTG